MYRKLFVSSAILLLLVGVGQVYAKGWSGGGGGSSFQPLEEKIVVAWDEEFSAHTFWRYIFLGYPLPIDAKKYVDWQMTRALYWFHKNFGAYVNLQVIGYTTWNSDNSLIGSENILKEAIQKTGFSNGLYFNCVRATVLIAFTHQATVDSGGGSLPNDHAVLIYHQEEWADDNVIMHEVSHLYFGGSPADTPHGDCVMSYEYVTMGWYSEPLDPDYGSVLLWAPEAQPWSYFSYNWCNFCKEGIMRGILTMCSPSDPWIPKINRDPIWGIVFFIGMGVSIVIGIWVLETITDYLKRRRKSNPHIHFIFLA